jgi:hypothetical protein
MISTDIVKPGLQPAEPIPPFIRAAHKNGIAELTERLYKTLLLKKICRGSLKKAAGDHEGNDFKPDWRDRR